MLTRRQLLQLGAIGGAGFIVGSPVFPSAAPPVAVGSSREAAEVAGGSAGASGA